MVFWVGAPPPWITAAPNGSMTTGEDIPVRVHELYTAASGKKKKKNFISFQVLIHKIMIFFIYYRNIFLLVGSESRYAFEIMAASGKSCHFGKNASVVHLGIKVFGGFQCFIGSHSFTFWITFGIGHCNTLASSIGANSNTFCLARLGIR